MGTTWTRKKGGARKAGGAVSYKIIPRSRSFLPPRRGGRTPRPRRGRRRRRRGEGGGEIGSARFRSRGRRRRRRYFCGRRRVYRRHRSTRFRACRRRTRRRSGARFVHVPSVSRSQKKSSKSYLSPLFFLLYLSRRSLSSYLGSSLYLSLSI